MFSFVTAKSSKSEFMEMVAVEQGIEDAVTVRKDDSAAPADSPAQESPQTDSPVLVNPDVCALTCSLHALTYRTRTFCIYIHSSAE